MFAAIWPAVGLPTGSEVAAVRADIRELRDELRAALAEAEVNEEYARELHEAVRHSIVNEREVTDQVRKSGSRRISAWSGWAGGEHMEVKDVGN
jgi:Spy/CpxP family protein refolding chaperone